MSTRFSAIAGQHSEALEAEQRKEEEREQIDYKMVTFSLAGKDYGVDIMKVKEIAKFREFTYVPNTPSFVRGVYNLRGDIISVIDLRSMFNLPVEEEEKSVEEGLILRLEERHLGVVVDEIHRVVGINSEHIQPPHPIFGDINIRYISGVVEYDSRLYIILDVERIFSKDGDQGMGQQGAQPAQSADTAGARSASASGAPGVGAAQAPRGRYAAEGGQEAGGSTETPEESTEPSTPQQEAEGAAAQAASSEAAEGEGASEESQRARELQFVKETLGTFETLHVSEINRAWVEQRFEEWRTHRREQDKSVQFETKDDALEFIQPFYSPHTGDFWQQDYVDAVRELLPEHMDNSINVWNPGCGKGFETYCLAVILRKEYPDSQIKIWAGDNDLLGISTAPNLVFQLADLPEYYHDWVVQGDAGYSFLTEIKDLIVFEYHDVLHAHTLPELDMILARDILSFLTPENQESVLEGFAEKLKDGGLFIPGANEDVSQRPEFERMQARINAYRKV